MTSRSPDHIYTKRPLFFWAICAVTSSWTLRSQLEPLTKRLVAETMCSVSQSIETVQALLVLSMWPFAVSSLNEDPSCYYSGLAWQMCLQLGLHRPLETHSHQYGSEADSRTEHEEVKITTWLAAFVVNNLQSTYRGVPPAMLVDVHLLNAFDHPNVDPTLSQLCRISHLLMQSTLAISSNGPTLSRMLEPEARLNMIRHYGEQFAALEAQYLQQISDPVMITFLTSRAQLWSFALLGDMSPSPERENCFIRARTDAISLIELCYPKNLSIAPHHVRWSMSFSAFVLIRVLSSPQTTDAEVLEDMIERVCQLLEVNSSSPKDTVKKACDTIRVLPKMKDRHLRAPILSRMGTSIVYDSLRIWVENRFYSSTHAGQAGATMDSFDLDGIDWYSLDPIL
ncbi:Regulatory protein leu3 [Knufia fluminis]|uniref:Regulatory protein leu3 n=1 Tax=Knufia fluminis TaxID=191047 RepID=A0AAN8EF43_9EURO|nr:Regulatory protein leu3 [Knufia fluminis]